MKSFMSYIIDAEESAMDNYLNDNSDFAFDYDEPLLDVIAFEDAAVAAASPANVPATAKKKFNLWEAIKGIFRKLINFFSNLIGVSKKTAEAAENAQKQNSQGSSDTNSTTTASNTTTTTASSKPATPRTVVPQKANNGADNTTQEAKPAPASVSNQTLISRLNNARSAYSKATEEAVKITFNCATASANLIAKIKSRIGKKLDSSVNDEIQRIEEMYRNASTKYNEVVDCRNNYNEAKENASSIRSIGKFLTFININHVKVTCEQIMRAASDHEKYCKDFVESIDAAQKKYGETIDDNQKIIYNAAKQYLNIAKLCNKSYADFRRCATDVFN